MAGFIARNQILSAKRVGLSHSLFLTQKNTRYAFPRVTLAGLNAFFHRISNKVFGLDIGTGTAYPSIITGFSEKKTAKC